MLTKQKLMFTRFTEFITAENLYDPGGKILLGVSGGVDSMVMMELFRRTGYPVIAAHCNFGLRGMESDEDQSFITGYCNSNNIPLYSRIFDTRGFAAGNRISVQMAARELRYSWFESLATDEGCTRIAIAHNKNDLAETFLINLVRGTGIRGLTGIRARYGKIIRPLLFAERKEILEYASRHNIPFREDSSNLEIKYKRNRIRHRIIPEFEDISPVFVSTLYETAKKLKDVEAIYYNTINSRLDEICFRTEQGYKISINSLEQLEPVSTWLYELLKRWNFPPEAIPDIAASLASSPGKQFFSPSHRLVKDREFLLVTPLDFGGPDRYYVEEDSTYIDEPLKLRLTRIRNHAGFTIPKKRGIACLDLDLLHFPLILRKWQKGDYFQPFGMNGLKKLSDFFIDSKLSLVDKEKTWLLASGNRIVWVIGHRIDDRFKITGKTGNILLVEVL